MQVFNADGPVHKLLYYEDKSMLVTITKSLMLSQHSVSLDGDCREILQGTVIENSMWHMICESSRQFYFKVVDM